MIARTQPGAMPVGAVVVGIAVVVALLPVLPAQAETSWQDLLQGAAEAARTRPYAGEALLLSTEEGQPRHFRVQVRHTPDSGLTIGADDARKLQLGADGGGLLDEAERWIAALPGLDVGTGEDLERLGEKYDVAVDGTERVMDRPCTVLEITRRRDGALRERLWIDEESGLLVRRETFEDAEEPVRLAAYLSLDLDPRRVGASASRAARRPGGADGRGKGGEPLDERELAALAESGWMVPDDLPAGYDPVGVFAVDAGESQPLQLVYGDGLYVVSLFQQRGRPDWSTLPAGAEQVDELDFPAWTWPGAMPPRLVWEADGRTWSLVGDAPKDDLHVIAAALPRDEQPGALEQLRRGLGRLWSWVTPWGQD